MATGSTKIQTIGDYLDTLSPEQRAGVEKLTRIIKAAAPQLEEGLNYSTPAYRLDGKLVVGIAAAKTHVGFYVMSAAVMGQFKNELKGYDVASTTIRIPYEAALPAALVKKIVLKRIEENGAKGRKKSK